MSRGARQAHAARKETTAAKPRIEAQIKAVVMLRLLPELRCWTDQIADLAELRKLEVVEAAHRIAPTIGEPRIDRRGDAVRIVVRGGHQYVVGRDEVAEPGAVIAEIESESWPELMLDRRRRGPAVLAVAETRGHVIRPPGIDDGGAEREVVDLGALRVAQRVL